MSRKAKVNWVTYAIVITLMALAIASFWLSFDSFSPESAYLKICALISAPLGLVAAWAFRRYPMTDTAGEIAATQSLPKKIGVFVGTAFFAALFSLTILCFGIGYIVTEITGEATALISTVDKVSSGRHKRRSCDHYYSVETLDNRHFKFCTQPRVQHQWHEGEVVNIYVKHSKLGYVAMKSNNSFKPTPLRGLGSVP
jgi:hypothetical protein